MTKLKTVIVDDEREALDSLEILLGEIEEVELVKKIENPIDVFPLLHDQKPDLILLDIHMPNISGIDLIAKIKECDPSLPVIFITAYDNYTLEAAQNSAFSYLLKPVNRMELKEIIKKVLKFRESISPPPGLRSNKIVINTRNESIVVVPEDVISMLADGNYTTMYLKNGKEFYTSINMGALSQRFPKNHFIRVNRSLMVNRDCIIGINRRKKSCIIKTSDGETLVDASSNFLRDFNSTF